MSRRRGNLYIITGPSGTGKGSICKEILKDEENEFSISMTTREARKGEAHGEDYYFVSEEEFLKNIEAGNFLEHAEVYDHRYGTPKDMVMKQLERGHNVILDIDTQGGLNVKKMMPESVLIFILPPSLAELRKRLEGRGTDSREVMEKRLSKAADEIKLIGEYDYYVVNDDIDEAVNQVKSIITAEKCRVPDKIKDIIKNYEHE